MGGGDQEETRVLHDEEPNIMSEKNHTLSSCPSPCSATADLSSHGGLLHEEGRLSPRRRGMPPKSLSRRGSRRFFRSDSELSLVKNQAEGDGDGDDQDALSQYRRGLPPKTLSRGGSRRLLRSDSDISLGRADMSSLSSSDPLLGSRASAARGYGDNRQNEELFNASCSSRKPFILDELMEEEEDEPGAVSGQESGMDDVLSDSLRGLRRHRRRGMCQAEAEQEGAFSPPLTN
ncbi:hypothetical protein ACA910_008962 [Epithemia clementina (nom. ined.)]